MLARETLGLAVNLKTQRAGYKLFLATYPRLQLHPSFVVATSLGLLVWREECNKSLAILAPKSPKLITRPALTVARGFVEFSEAHIASVLFFQSPHSCSEAFPANCLLYIYTNIYKSSNRNKGEVLH